MGVDAKVGGIGQQTGFELGFLGVHAVLAIAALAAQHLIAGAGVQHLGAGVEDHPLLAVVQHGVEEVIGLGAGTLGGDIQPEAIGLTKELQALIQQVRTQIKPEPGPRQCLLAPAFPYHGTITIDMGVKLLDLAQLATGNHLAQGEEVGIPAAVVKYRQQPIPAARQLGQLQGLGASQGKGLVHHHMLACQQGGLGQRIVTIIGGGDHDQLQIGEGDQALGRRAVFDIGPVISDLDPIAGGDGSQAYP